MGLLKPIALSLTGTAALFLMFPGNYKRFDRNVLRPIRNYRSNLQDYNRFQLQEEFTGFLSELGMGIVNTFRGK